VFLLTVDNRDHSAGNAEWRHRFVEVKVFGGELDSVPSATE